MATEFSEAIAPWIAERAVAREAAWADKRARKAAERLARKAARDAGLKRRYALKAARIQQQASIT